MKKSDWGIKITKVSNGFIIKNNDGNRIVVRADDENETLAAANLLQEVIEFFNLSGDRYARERIAVIIQVGDKYVPKEDEKLVKEYCLKVVKK